MPALTTARMRWHSQKSVGTKKSPTICANWDWRSNFWRTHMKGIAMWLALSGIALAVAAAIARGFWLYRASLTWLTADGTITRLDVERKHASSGHFFLATFSYDF